MSSAGQSPGPDSMAQADSMAARMAAPAVMVIFGVTGDLSKRYLLPALYHLCKDGLLPTAFRIIGTSRRPLQLDEFLGQVEICVLEQDNVCDPVVLNQLRGMMELFELDPNEAVHYASLRSRLDALENEQGTCLNRLYYLSIPPQLYTSVVRNLGAAKLNTGCRHNKATTRLLVEKPFGRDVDSAEALIADTAKVFSEEQTFRIDHYLAKETVQDIVLFRQKNPELEAHWNGRHIEKIEIAAYEQLGVGGRHFYDQIGALRDLIQSHLWQLLGLITMELPAELTSEHIHARKTAALQSIGRLPAERMNESSVHGQYDDYRAEVANDHSATETFAAVRFTHPGERWQGTDIVVATGKGLNEKRTEICVYFRGGDKVHFRIQPAPGIALSGSLQAHTDFSDKPTPLNHPAPDAYERVLIDAMRGDKTLFASDGEILASWRSLQPVLDEWGKDIPPLVHYPRGSDPATLIPFQ